MQIYNGTISIKVYGAILHMFSRLTYEVLAINDFSVAELQINILN